MADGLIKKFIDNYVNAHSGDTTEDTPVGTAGFYSAPDAQDVAGAKQSAQDWWDWRSKQGFIPEPEDVVTGLAPMGIAGTFAGVGAKTANLLKMQEAEAALAKGSDPKQVWSNTGWGRGADGKMRYEINDSGAKIKDGVDEKTLSIFKDTRLGDVLDHPELYSAYPELADVPLRSVAFSPFTQGYYNSEKNAMGLSSNLLKKYAEGERRSFMDPDGKTGIKTLLHESQHYIQNKEGMATGDNPDRHISKSVNEGYNNASDRYRQITAHPEFNKAMEDIADVFNLDNFTAHHFEKLYKGEPVIVRDHGGGKLRELHPDEVEAMKVFVDNEPVLLDAMDTLNQVTQGKSARANGNRIYKESLGERESRDVERRHEMPDSERSNTYPESFTPPEDPLKYPKFAKGGLVANSSVNVTDDKLPLLMREANDAQLAELTNPNNGAPDNIIQVAMAEIGRRKNSVAEAPVPDMKPDEIKRLVAQSKNNDPRYRADVSPEDFGETTDSLIHKMTTSAATPKPTQYASVDDTPATAPAPYTPDTGLMGRAANAMENADTTMNEAMRFGDKLATKQATFDNAAANPMGLGNTATAAKPAASKGSFGSAFKAARAAGLQSFEWNGKKYHTRRADENQSQWKKNVGFAEGGMPEKAGLMMQPSEDVGALPSEKADDINAKLSEGEFVIPAEEVRWHGLKTFMHMKEEAQRGLMQMKDMGQIQDIGGSDEPEPPSDIPVDEPDPVSTMGHYASGGLVNKMSGYDQQTDAFGNPHYVSSKPTVTVPNLGIQNTAMGIRPTRNGGALGSSDGSVDAGKSDNPGDLLDAVINSAAVITAPVSFAAAAMMDPNNSRPSITSAFRDLGVRLGIVTPTLEDQVPEMDPVEAQKNAEEAAQAVKDAVEKDAAQNDPTAPSSNEGKDGSNTGNSNGNTGNSTSTANAAAAAPGAPGAGNNGDPSNGSGNGDPGHWKKGGLITRPKCK